MKKLLLLGILLLTSINSFAVENGFKDLGTKEIVGEKVLIQEFFFYGCPHCYKLEEKVKEWKKTLDVNKVIFETIPVDYGSLSLSAAKHHYAADILGKLDSFKEIYFQQILLKKKNISDELAIDILVSLGEKKEKAKEAIDSFMIKTKVDQARELSKKYKINSVPSFVVNGKYYVDIETARGVDNLFKALNKLSNK